MATVKERFDKWKSRKLQQKIGDVVFWIFLILMLIPGPRKAIATGMNKVMLNIRKPTMVNAEKAIQLSPDDFVWDIQDKNGTNLSPEELTGEVIFLNFWGTYCPPCLAELPEIQGLYDTYKDKVKFVLVSGEAPEKVESFLAARNHALPSYYGGRSLPSALSIKSVPTTYIISRDGKIVSKKVGAADWNSKATHKMLDELLDNPL